MASTTPEQSVTLMRSASAARETAANAAFPTVSFPPRALSLATGVVAQAAGQALARLQRWTSVLLFVALWETVPRLATKFDLFDATFIPPFSAVLRAFWDMCLDGTLVKHASISLQRSAMGFALANAIAIPLGLVIGSFPVVERFCDPILQTLRQTAAMALFPVFIMLFGIGEPSKVILICWGAQWPILLSTIAGVKTMDPLLTKAARSMNSTTAHLFLKVMFPAAFPSIFTGMRLAATNSILILIAAEMIGADRGLGYLVYDSQVRYEIPLMYAGISSLSLLGLAVNHIMMAIDRRNSWTKKGSR
jgi:NitT/TauT family transport system permease protein